MLRECSAFIWDEAPMCSKNAIKVVDKLLQNIMQSDLPFGGKIFIFGGDFRQVFADYFPDIKDNIMVGNCRDTFINDQ